MDEMKRINLAAEKAISVLGGAEIGVIWAAAWATMPIRFGMQSDLRTARSQASRCPPCRGMRACWSAASCMADAW